MRAPLMSRARKGDAFDHVSQGAPANKDWSPVSIPAFKRTEAGVGACPGQACTGNEWQGTLSLNINLVFMGTVVDEGLPTTEPDKDEFLKLFQGKFEDKAAKVVVGCAGLPASQRSQVLLMHFTFFENTI